SGVRLQSGERIAARAVAANVPPKLLFRDLVPPAAMDPELRRRFVGLKSGSATFRMNVALAELPDFRCRPGTQQQDHHGSGSVIAAQVLSPLDLERRFGLLDGDIFHGQLTLDQLYSARPVLGHADYRMPLPALYLCGSGAHPGGGVTGLPGRNAALGIIRDFRRRRWIGAR